MNMSHQRAQLRKASPLSVDKVAEEDWDWPEEGGDLCGTCYDPYSLGAVDKSSMRCYGWWKKHCTTSQPFCCLCCWLFSAHPLRPPALTLGLAWGTRGKKKIRYLKFVFASDFRFNIKARGSKGEEECSDAQCLVSGAMFFPSTVWRRGVCFIPGGWIEAFFGDTNGRYGQMSWRASWLTLSYIM